MVAEKPSGVAGQRSNGKYRFMMKFRRSCGWFVLGVLVAVVSSLISPTAQGGKESGVDEPLQQNEDTTNQSPRVLKVSRSPVDQAESHFKREFGDNPWEIGIKLHNLANSYRWRGRDDLALPLLQRAIVLLTKNPGPDHPDMAFPVNTLGNVYRFRGQLDRAMVQYQKAIAILDSNRKKWRTDNNESGTGFVDHEGIYAHIINNLGDMHLYMRQYIQAMKLYRQSRAIREDKFGADSPEVAYSLGKIAEIYHLRGNYPQAFAHYNQCLEIQRKTSGPHHLGTAYALKQLASLHWAVGQIDQALPLYEKALEIVIENVGRDDHAVASFLLDLAVLWQAKDDDQKSVHFFKRALSIVEDKIQTSMAAMTPNERLIYVQFLRKYLNYWLIFTRESAMPAYDEVLRFKGMVTRATEVEWFMARNVNAETRRLLDKLMEANMKLSRLSNDIPTEAKRLNTWRAQYAHEAQYCEGLSRQVAALSSDYRNASQRLKITVADIQSNLEPHERIIDFIRYSDRYAAWVIGRQGQPIRVELGRANTVEAAITGFRNCMTWSQGPVPIVARDHADPRFLAAGQKLGELIWKPIARYLDDTVTTLYLVPDAALATVPFAALPTTQTDHQTGKHQRVTPQFLLNQYTLAYLYFAQDIVPWQKTATPGQGLLVVGGVDYDRSDQDLPRGLPGRWIEEAQLTLPDPSTRSLKRLAPGKAWFSSLPGTRLEAQSVLERFMAMAPDEPRYVLEGPHATEDLLRKLAPGRRIVHVATHGYVESELPSAFEWATMHCDSEQPGDGSVDFQRQLGGYDPMLLFYLVMAGFNQREGGGNDDGAITALEVSAMDLDGVELAVLSACSTAGGTVRGGEGVLGLVRAFRLAGARSVVASLWPVQDMATQQIMEHFYDNLLSDEKPCPPVEALSRAMCAVRSSGVENREHVGEPSDDKSRIQHRRFDAPADWAAFVVYGPIR